MITIFEKYNDNFWEWFDNSKIVDANGNPQKVYHGTTKDFDEFQRTSGEFGGGIYFSRNPEDAAYYSSLSGKEGRSILPVYLSIQNPYYYDIWNDKKHLPTRTSLIKKGYDGVIGKTANGTEEIVAFFPYQIKSATGNSGDFNKTNPSMLERKVSVKKTLCPEIWVDNHIEEKLRMKLLRIARDFYKSLELEAEIIDIQLTGSIANYNYTRFSDLDIHIIIDFTEIDNNTKLVKKAIDGQRFIWNIRHNIVIRGHDVELYVQDKTEEHVSSGIYSLIDEKWVVVPKISHPTTDTKDVDKKYNDYVDVINRLETVSKKQDLTPEEHETYYEYIHELKSKIMTGRKEGLANNGEFSVENLVFKKLRNNEKIEKIIDLTAKFYDMIYSQ